MEYTREEVVVEEHHRSGGKTGERCRPEVVDQSEDGEQAVDNRKHYPATLVHPCSPAEEV